MSYNLRPEQLIECPYDKNHKVSAARLANHIVKCKRVKLIINIRNL